MSRIRSVKTTKILYLDQCEPNSQVLPPDLDDYIGHSRLLRKYTLDLATDSQPLAQSGSYLFS